MRPRAADLYWILRQIRQNSNSFRWIWDLVDWKCWLVGVFYFCLRNDHARLDGRGVTLTDVWARIMRISCETSQKKHIQLDSFDLITYLSCQLDVVKTKSRLQVCGFCVKLGSEGGASCRWIHAHVPVSMLDFWWWNLLRRMQARIGVGDWKCDILWALTH